MPVIVYIYVLFTDIMKADDAYLMILSHHVSLL